MEENIKYISITELIPGEFQSHIDNDYNNLDNLATSIKNHGIITPLVVRPKGIQYEIILGNRRYNSAKAIGMSKLPVIIQNLTDEQAIEMIILDNIQRQELSGKEEAFLYRKLLEYPNINKEKISISLGIPLDRINSKVELSNREIKVNKETNYKIDSAIQQPTFKDNSINSDIISLSELNKEEEREENIMNNNQNNLINENNNNLNQQVQQPSPVQEPTFGGRFFPSLEDEPTNMNLSQNSGAFQQQSNQMNYSQPLTAPSPLIDLTGTNQESVQQQTSNYGMQNSQPLNNNIGNFKSNPSENFSSLATGQNITPNLEQLNNQNINTMPLQQQVVDNNSQLNNSMQSIPNNNDNIAYNQINTTPNITSDVQYNQPLPSSVNQGFVPTPNLNESPISNSSINTQEVNNINPLNSIIPNISSQNTLNGTQQSSVANNISPAPLINEPTQSNDGNLDTNSPSNNTMPNNYSEDDIDDEDDDELDEIPEEDDDMDKSINNMQTSKDVTPVINMFKNMAISLESLGYKLNINENNSEQSYTINIEVEK